MSYHSYWSYNSREAHEQGHQDEFYSRLVSYDFDRYSSDERDRAYFEGREDERREEEHRCEEREEERCEERRHHQAMLDKAQEDAYYESIPEPVEEPEP